MKDLAGKAREWSKVKEIAVKEASALGVLVNNEYVYVYFETTPGSSSFAASDDDCVLQLGEQDVKNMLSFSTVCILLFMLAVARHRQALDALDLLQ